MKALPTNLKKLILSVSTLALMFSASGVKSATVAYWDPQGSAAATAANLTTNWTTTGLLWSTNSAGALTATPTTVPANWAVCFAAGTTTMTNPFVVTLTNAVTVGGVFNGLGALPGFFVTISGAGGSIHLNSGASGFNGEGSDGGSTTINVPITGVGPVAMEGSAPFIFNATNTYTGGTLLGFPGVNFNGVLNFSTSNAFGTGPIVGISTATAPALAIAGTLPLTITNAIIPTNGNINLAGSAAGLTFSGPITLTAAGGKCGFGSGSATAGITILSGPISGGATFYKYNGGTMVLSGSNSYLGGTIISNAGPFVITQDANLGNTNGGVTIYAGSVLTASNSFELLPSRSITLGGAATINVATGKTLTNSAPISGAFALTKTGSGTMILNAPTTGQPTGESYTGNTTITTGTLQLGIQATLASPTITIANGATFDISLQGGYDFDANSQTLIAAGTTSTTTLKVSSFSGATLGSSSPLILSYKPTTFRGDLAHPSLVVNNGPLTLSGNITVSNIATSAMGPGVYTILKCATNASVDVSSPPTVTLVGTQQLALNCTGVFQWVTNSLQLIVTIPPSTISSVVQAPNGNVTVTGLGLSGSPYRLAATTNLAASPIVWTILATNIADGSGNITLTDTNTSSFSTRFYRIDY